MTQATSVRSEPLAHADPAAFATRELQLPLDPIQSKLLREDPHRCIINCCRQWGKSTITAAKAVHTALTKPDSLTLVLSPSARQSAEFLRKASQFLKRLNILPRGDSDNEISLLLPNGSRIVGLPGRADTILGFSNVSFLIVDEAALVSDELYHNVRPMLAFSNGQLWIISTPRGHNGFFYNAWMSPDSSWTRVTVPATECPRIRPEFLAEERITLPESRFRQDYLCEFLESDDTVFPAELLQDALISDLSPYPIGLKYSGLYIPDYDPAQYVSFPHCFIGFDVGKIRDYSALGAIERAEIVTGPRSPVNFEFPTATRFAVRHLERLPLGLDYVRTVEYVCDYLRHPSLGKYKTLVVDATGVGTPVVDLLRRASPSANIVPVVFTGGGKPTRDGSTYRVPRRDLLTSLEIAFQNRRLKICSGIEASKTLIHELSNLKHNLRESGQDVIEPGRITIHDDLVFAIALANWRASERLP